jgi:hypothetical protein
VENRYTMSRFVEFYMLEDGRRDRRCILGVCAARREGDDESREFGGLLYECVRKKCGNLSNTLNS